MISNLKKEMSRPLIYFLFLPEVYTKIIFDYFMKLDKKPREVKRDLSRYFESTPSSSC